MPISTVKFNDWQAVPPENMSRANFIPDHTTEHIWRIFFIIQILVAIVMIHLSSCHNTEYCATSTDSCSYSAFSVRDIVVLIAHLARVTLLFL